jgi:hypothetical protein
MNRLLTKNSTRSAHRFLPTLEALETRWCPSAVGISQNGSTLVIQGDSANDTVKISDNGQGAISASISLASGTKTVNATGITTIKINSGNGSDSISYALTNPLAQQEQLTLNMGKGNSQINLDFSAGLQYGQLAVNFDGGEGSDQLTTTFGALTGSRLNLNECLGQSGATSHVNFAGALNNSLAVVVVNGGAASNQVFAQLGDASSSNLQFMVNFGKKADSFDLEETGNLQNAVVHFDLDGGAGGANILLNAKNVNLDTTSRLNLDSWSGSGKDNVKVNYSGQMNGELWLDLEGGKGKDTMTAVLTLAQGSTGRLNGTLHGGKGDDTMTFDVFDNSNPGGPSTLAKLYAVINPGSGHNIISATPNVKIKN